MGRVDLFAASKEAIVVELQATGEDKSPKGCLDAQVVDVVQAVNEHDDLVTTSSCSGRVALFASEGEEDVPVRDNGNFGDEVVETESTSAPLNKETATNQTPRKGAGRWLSVSHEAVWSGKDLSALIKSRESRLTQVVFKLEPFVLHVLCRDAAIAQRLLRAAMECGFRESGISLGPKKIIVAVRTTANALEVPLVHKGKLLLDDNALDALCKIATTKFDANTTRRNRFLAKVKALEFDREAIPANKKTADEEQQSGQVEWSRLQFDSPELSGVLERWGHSAVALDDQQVVVFGGYGCGSTGGRVHQRLNDLILLKETQDSKWEVSVVTPFESSAPAPSARVRHSCNLLLGNHLVVFGGRHGPSAALNDFHAFNVDTSQWQEVSVSMSGDEPLTARWGHTSTTLPGGNTFAIFGGRNDSQLFNDLIFVTVKPNSNGTQILCEKPSMSGDIPDARFSHSATLVGEDTLMVFGGYGALAVETSKSDLVIGTTHLLDLNTMVWTKVASGRPRFSHQAVAVGTHRVLITGGVCGEFSNSTAALFDTQTQTWHSVPSGDAYGGQASPVAMFQKFSLVSLGGDKQRIVALGGGALCFSFGFYFSPPLLCNGIAWLGSIDLTPNAVLAAKSSTKQIKNLLEKSKLYDKSRRIAPFESEVAIPVLDTLKALQALELGGKSSIAVFAQLPPAKLTLANASQLETKKVPPSQRLEYRKSYTTLSSAKRKEITPPPATPPQDAKDGLALVIPARMCKTVKTKLEEGGIYDKSRLIAPHGNGNLAVPFQGDKKLALEVAKSLGAAETEVIQVELPLAKLEAANLRALNEAKNSNPSKKEHPKRRAAAASGTVRAKVLDWLVQKAPGQVPANDAKLRREIPNKLSLMDDVAIVPSECFKTTEVWDPVFALGEDDEDKCLWSFLARLAGAKRVLQQRRIDPGVKRSSRAALVFPRGESEEKGAMVAVKQNGVIYALDLTKCMFSAGNISEKTRVAEFDCSGQTVVDLFSGIGYFTLPYLVKTKAVHVHACEWNAEALDALRNNVALNKVDPAFVSIHPGDCRETVRTKLHGVADRVNLGLIPSSEPFWPSGAAALKPTSGGWLHVHENVDRNKQTEWVARLERDLAGFCSEAHGGEWVVLCKHLERVKSYSPRVDHVVADVLCTPKALASSDALKTVEKRKTMVEQAEASLSARPSRVRYPPREITPRKIETVECPKTLAEARALFAKGEPVVLLNAVSSETQALASLAALSRLCSEDTSVAEQQVSVHVADPGTKGKLSFVHKSFKFHVMKFQELLARAHEEDTFCYLRAIGSNPRKDRAHFWRDFKKLADHLKFDFPGHLIAQEHSSVLRIASKGLQLWTHYDVMQNILFQLEGRKRVLLFPPSASNALDFRGSSSSIVEVDNLEDVDLNSPFAQARREAIEFYLEPGQALFIPPLWPHNVRSEEPGVAVNVFFKHLKDSQYASKDLYGNRDPIVAEKALEMVARAKDVLRAAQDDGSTLPPEYIEFYTGIAAALLHDD